jgi:hypothetical protein
MNYVVLQLLYDETLPSAILKINIPDATLVGELSGKTWMEGDAAT